MAKRNPVPAKPRRHSLPASGDFITAAEARGEAAYIVLHALLRRIPRSMCKSAMAEAYHACDTLGVEAITLEVDSLFWNIAFRDQA